MGWLTEKPSNTYIEGRYIDGVEIVVDVNGYHRKVVIKLNNGRVIEVEPDVSANIKDCDPNDPSYDCYLENVYLVVRIR